MPLPEKNAGGRGANFKNTPGCCRKSGNVYSYKANWRVAGEPAILKFEPRPVAFFFWCIHVYNAFALGVVGRMNDFFALFC